MAHDRKTLKTLQEQHKVMEEIKAANDQLRQALAAAEARAREAEETARAAEKGKAQFEYLREKMISSNGWYTRDDHLAWLKQSEDLTSRAHS